MELVPEKVRAIIDSRPGDFPQDFDVESECEHINELIRTYLAEELKDYRDIEFEGAGGSGLVVSAVFSPFGTRRALKFPRKRIFAEQGSGASLSPEIHALTKLSHKNIIRLYSALEIGGSGNYCIITDYIEDATPLDKYAEGITCCDLCRKSSLVRSEGIKKFAGIIYSVADALQYMHDIAKLLHFDIKPDNVLVDSCGVPFITDLGFARDVSRLPKDELIQVGFTWKYAHPSLRDPHEGARVSQTPAKAKNHILGSNITSALDIYAFGRTLQECLRRLELVYGDNVSSDYGYNYLHLLGALCLDGKNAANPEPDPKSSFVSDQPLGIPTAVFDKHKFTSFSDVRCALERLLGFRRIEDEIPELDPFSASTVNVSNLGVTTFTPRVRVLVEHPLVQRLRGEYQLGVLDTVFPTATHTRFQHSLGVFHCACMYVSALYYDPENPLFRILFSPLECRATLCAALVHDLGQTTLGHELEEVDPKVFSHETITTGLLRSDMTDRHGRTLGRIISEAEPTGWGVTVDDVVRKFSRTSLLPIDSIWHDIIDGEIDADRLDYLTRDSHECRVQYGAGIDYARFIRSLTTSVVKTKSGKSEIQLAVKRKGAASADAFAFARYQLYQSLYWHHTERAAKSMFLMAATGALENAAKLEDDSLFGTQDVLPLYLSHVIKFSSPPPKSKPRPKRSKLEAQMDSELPSSLNTGHPADLILGFLYRLAEGKSRKLIEDLSERNLYKRLIEVPVGGLNEDQWYSLKEKMRERNRQYLNHSVEISLSNLLSTEIQGQSANRVSLDRDELLERLDVLSKEKTIFVVDIPTRGTNTAGPGPKFVSDFKRRHFRGGSAAADGDDSSELWGDVMGKMMRRIMMFRVYAEPEIHRMMTLVLGPHQVLSAIEDIIPELKQ